MQALQGNKTTHSRKHSRQVPGAFVIAVALAAAGASFTFLSQDVSDLLSAVLAVIGIMAVAGAWVVVGPGFAARLLALGQGMVWFFLLIHGGLGLVFGPAAWAASAIGNRVPRLAAALLAVPAGFLAVSWLPIVFSADGLGLSDRMTILALIAPAVVAVGIFVRAHLQQDQKPVT